MIIYFADRKMQVLGHATTNLPDGYVIKEDLKTEEIETGVATFSCRIGFNKNNRKALEAMTNAGNYLFRKNDGENEFYTIIDTDIDTKRQEIYVYAEDAGLDLLNERADSFEATETHNAEWYINKYIVDSGFEIGINEIPSSTTRKLAWEGETTVTERLASIATQFGNYEISFSFDIKGLEITNKYINIHEKRGKDAGVQLRLNKEIDRIVTSKTVANLATAFVCEGSVPDNAEEPITLKGYKYDDGDFFVDSNGKLKSRKANKKWSRYVWNKEPNLTDEEGYIVRPYSYKTTEQSTLCSHAVAELKKICDMEINYEIDIKKLPEGVKIGDRVNIIDDDGELYVSTRVLKFETSIVDQEYTATLGEHLIKTSGISEKVIELAAKFAESSASAQRALEIATTAKANANEAKSQVEAVATQAASAQTVANEAKTAAATATESAANAQAKALAAQAAVDKVEESVSSMETTIENAQAAADNAQQAAQTAQAKADEAKTAAQSAQSAAGVAATKADTAQALSASANTKAAQAKVKAESASANAKSAIDTAEAAKLDAKQAERDIATFTEQLETVTDTLQADYARKTELTETTAHLQSQITRSAAGLSSTVSLLQTIDETANDAREKADMAEAEADEAQAKADDAAADAEAAQTAANEAKQAAINAKNDADTARAAAETARNVAEQAEADFEAAKIDLATIQARADATEAEIAAAQAAVATAQTTADRAKADAENALETATTAQATANEAALNAWNSQIIADKSKAESDLAQQLADKASSEWDIAKNEAFEAETLANQANTEAEIAQAAAEEAQEIAKTAIETAETAQATADTAKAEAEAAQATADEAYLIVEQAISDLALAQDRLAEVLADAEATEEEIAEAQTAVASAQAAADTAGVEAETAQAAADTATANAEAAQTAANEAQVAALNAQEKANEAQDAAAAAQAVVDGLAVRVTKTETNITQNQREIALRVTEVEKSTSENEKNISKAESLIRQLSDSISMLVTDGNGSSLMVQTESGWTFSTGALQDSVDKSMQQLGALTEDLGSTKSAVNVLNSAVKDLGVLAEYIKIGTYTYTDENGNEQTEPSIDLGENDTGFRLKITNTRIWFTDGSTDLVSIDSKNKSLEIEKATIKGELLIGDEINPVAGVWIWKQRSNGNLGLMWKGVSE